MSLMKTLVVQRYVIKLESELRSYHWYLLKALVRLGFVAARLRVGRGCDL